LFLCTIDFYQSGNTSVNRFYPNFPKACVSVKETNDYSLKETSFCPGAGSGDVGCNMPWYRVIFGLHFGQFGRRKL
jgi:hypothetical protein